MLSGKTYDEAFELAKSHEKHIDEVGGCTSVDASGPLWIEQHGPIPCAPYTSTTKNEMRRWITLEESEAFPICSISQLHVFSSDNLGLCTLLLVATAVANMVVLIPLGDVFMEY